MACLYFRYAFSLCRKALELHNEDIDKAESWLNAEAMKQGWQKADMIKVIMNIQLNFDCNLLDYRTNQSTKDSSVSLLLLIHLWQL